ncbi:MAG TPA: hypothetical protein VJ438_06275 [Candidatus Nanoarchaeia archaeon]|nr:hypothetical protein [Candidatus Nanoarchaeia archaeon]
MPKKRKNIFWIVIEIIILLIFIKPMFDLNIVTGIFYVFAIILAFWKGFIFRRRWVSWMIILGTILSYFAGAYLLPWALGSYLAGDIVSAVIVAVLLIYIWLKSRKLKKGEH